MKDLVALLLLLAVATRGAPPPLSEHRPLQQQGQGRGWGRGRESAFADENDIPNIVNFGLSREEADQPVVIFRQIQDQDVQGSYAWEYELENGIVASEEGHMKNAGTPNATQVAQGSFSYVAPDGITYTVTYTADENGFQAQGVHLPTPPPMPIELERAYAKAKARPGYQEENED